MKRFTDKPLWNRSNAIVSRRHHLGDALVGDISLYAATARAEDLSGLPRTYVSTMEYDPLRDEGIRHALRLLEHGVSVELHQFPGTFRGSSMLINAEISRRSSEEMMTALRRRLRLQEFARQPVGGEAPGWVDLQSGRSLGRTST